MARTTRQFTLVCHEAPAGGGGPAVAGRVERCGPLLVVRYRLPAAAAPGLVRAAGARPRRRDGLWRDTCCELFLAEPDAPGYLEINLAPDGDWNAYRFDRYREGGRPEPAIRELRSRAAPGAPGPTLTFALDLRLPGLDAPELAAGVSAVIRARDGSLGHWALRHGAGPPDFHCRDGFALRLPR